MQARLAQSQHRYNEVNHLLARAEQVMDQQQLATNALLCAEFNALRAQVAINAGKPDEAGRLASEALAVFPLASYYGRIVATSIKGEVLHFRGDLNQALSLMQETCQMARHHDICHDALWALLQQSEILIAQGDAQSAYETRDNAFALIREQGLEQLPMHEFLLRLRAQLLWSWSRLDDAEQAVRQGLSRSNSCSAWRCWPNAPWRVAIWTTPAVILPALKICSVTVTTAATG